MGLLSDHSVLHDNPMPFGKKLPCFWQDWKLLQESGDCKLNNLKWPSETVHVCRASGDNPELSDHLWRQIDFVALRDQFGNCANCDNILSGMKFSRAAEHSC